MNLQDQNNFDLLTLDSKSIVQKFKRENPFETILIANECKAIETKTEKDIVKGFAWLMAYRSPILLTENRIIYKKWSIAITEIEAAKICKYRGGQVLKIQTKKNKYYQFGLPQNDDWIQQSIINLKEENVEIKFS